MHNTLVLLTQQTFADNCSGGRTKESIDNSQLSLGVYRLESPKGKITFPEGSNAGYSSLLIKQLSEGIILASKSFNDKRDIETIAIELAQTYGGSGGCCVKDKYRSVEFATSAKEKLVDEYFR